MRIHSLTSRFVLTLLLSTAVPFLVFAYVAGAGLRARQEEFVDGLLRSTADSIGSSLASRLEQFHRECSLIQNNAERALAHEISIADFKNVVEFSPKFHSEFHLVVLADAKGDVAVQVDSLSQDGQALRRRRVRDDEWFKRLAEPDGATQAGQLWLDRHLSSFLHRDTQKLSKNPADYSYGLAFPVHVGGRVGGVVLALKRWAGVQDEIDHRAEVLRESFPDARTFVYDANCSVLAHSDRSQYGEHCEVEFAEDERAVAEFVRGDQRWRAGMARIHEVAESIDWRVGVAAADSSLFAASRQFANLMLVVTMIVAGILVVWALFASRAILRPVRRLGAATKRIAAGDFEARVPAEGRHELADLGRAFNDMASEVSASRDRLRDAERQAAWAEMARQVAHEIKNPLTPMRMSAQLLLRANREKDERLPELVERLGKTVQDQTDALARIAADFRQFAGEPARQPVCLSVEQLIEDVSTDFAATVESGVALGFEVGEFAAQVEVDRQEIRRVFLNLVQNALEAAGVDGEVWVRARLDGENVVFSVSDTGPGIEDLEVRDRLFEPYFTTRSAGTGLGLAICRRIVEAHGGNIELASSAPGDTEFRFTLPVR